MSKKKIGRKAITQPAKHNIAKITEPIKAAKVHFDFSDNRWLCSVRKGEYTNFLKDAEQCLKTHYNLFYTIVPKVLDEWDRIKTGFGTRQYPHCHKIEGKQRELVLEVYKELYNYELGEEVSLYQLSFTGANRLIVIYGAAKETIKPIFIDHHHQIYPSIKHNQKDLSSYNYCIVCSHK